MTKRCAGAYPLAFMAPDVAARLPPRLLQKKPSTASDQRPSNRAVAPETRGQSGKKTHGGGWIRGTRGSPAALPLNFERDRRLASASGEEEVGEWHGGEEEEGGGIVVARNCHAGPGEAGPAGSDGGLLGVGGGLWMGAVTCPAPIGRPGSRGAA